MTNDTENIHRIRLKGPWEAAFVADEMTFERIHVPINWRDAFGKEAGTVCFRRKFHTPSGLTSRDTVQLRIPDGTGTVADFQINNEPLLPSEDNPLLFDVTEKLHSFNAMEFRITFDPNTQTDIPGGLWEAVFLEIISG